MIPARSLLQEAEKDIGEAFENGEGIVRANGYEIHQRRLSAVQLSFTEDVQRTIQGRAVNAIHYLQTKFEWEDEVGFYEALDDDPRDVSMEIGGARDTWRVSEPWDGSIMIEAEDVGEGRIVFDLNYKWTQVERL